MPPRILIVDDEPALLAVLEQYLRRLGYEVVACRSGQQAWQAFAPEPASFSLVLADATMPGIPSEELLLRMLQLNPNISILICSGYPFDPAGFSEKVHAPIGFLQKPFTPRMLAEAIERLRRARPAAG